MMAIFAGEATTESENGADYWLAYHKKLPDYYMTKNDSKSLAWKKGKSPSKYAPDKMIGGDIFSNTEGHLPNALEREWYEADINYHTGKRMSIEFFIQMMA